MGGSIRAGPRPAMRNSANTAVFASVAQIASAAESAHAQCERKPGRHAASSCVSASRSSAILAALAVPSLRAALRCRRRPQRHASNCGGPAADARQFHRRRPPGVLCLSDAAGQLPARDGSGDGVDRLPRGRTAHLSPRRRSVLPAGIVLRATRNRLDFWPDALAASTSTLTICDTQGIAPPRAIVISQAGRVRLADGAARTAVHEDARTRIHAGGIADRAVAAVAGIARRGRCCSMVCARTPKRCATRRPRTWCATWPIAFAPIRAARALLRVDAIRSGAAALRAAAALRSRAARRSRPGALHRRRAAPVPRRRTPRTIEYEPAIGPAAPDRYAITLRWRGPRDDQPPSRCICWRSRWRAERGGAALARLQPARAHGGADHRPVPAGRVPAVLERCRRDFAANESLAQLQGRRAPGPDGAGARPGTRRFLRLAACIRAQLVRGGTRAGRRRGLRQPDAMHPAPPVAGLPAGAHDCGVQLRRRLSARRPGCEQLLFRPASTRAIARPPPVPAALAPGPTP